MDTNKIIETRTSSVWIGSDNIVRIIKKTGTEENLSDAKEVVEAIRKLTLDKPYPAMVNFRGMKSQSEEAQQYYSGYFSKHNEVACALVTGDYDNSDLAKNYIEEKKPTTPTRFFRTEESALTWLKGFVLPEY